jgi:hypothetical protein
MSTFELVVIVSVLSGCAGGLCWTLRDMCKQLKAYEENCIGIEEDDDDKE